MSPTRRTLVQAIAGGALALTPLGMTADTINDLATLRARLVELRDDALAYWERSFEEDEWGSEVGVAIGFVDALEAVIMATCPHGRDSHYPSEDHRGVVVCPHCNAEAEIAPRDAWDVSGHRTAVRYVVTG